VLFVGDDWAQGAFTCRLLLRLRTRHGLISHTGTVRSYAAVRARIVVEHPIAGTFVLASTGEAAARGRAHLEASVPE